MLALVIGYPVPLALAVIMSDVRRARGLYALLAYLPVVIPPAVAVLLWKFFYDAEPTGVFNTILGWVGLGPVPWLEDPSWAMPALVMEATWAAAGGTVIIYLAALVTVRRSCTTPRRSTAPASGRRSGTSRSRTCAGSC